MKFQIWYMRPEFFREGNMGHQWLEEHDMLPDPKALSKTHIHLKDFDTTFEDDVLRELELVWVAMQGERWSPNGEARGLIKSKGLQHTSMSVGDIAVEENGNVWMVDTFGFHALHVALPATA